MENEKETIELNNKQLEVVTGGGVGDSAQWKIIGYCPNCKDRLVRFCSMYPGEGPFYCTCGTQLTDVRVEEL